MLLQRAMVSFRIVGDIVIGESSADGSLGDTAVALLKAGADTDKKDVDGCLPLDLAPDNQVRYIFSTSHNNDSLT
jgi:hypothetical protein